MMAERPTIVSVYNRYLDRGGEDEVFESEAELLERSGWRVIRVIEQTRTPRNVMEAVVLAAGTAWSRTWHRRISRIVEREDVTVAHVHNWFPVMSPSIYDAFARAGVPVVQTLHNYRLGCLKATLYRDGRVCEDCLGLAIPWPGVWHACYRGSHTQSSVVAAMLVLHRGLQTWTKRVDQYVALSDFARGKLVDAGLPKQKIVVKPNFVWPDPGVRERAGGYALYVGRVSREKGVETLLRAWSGLAGIPLKIVGDGPFRFDAEAFVANEGLQNVEFLGRLSRSDVLTHIKNARFVIFPSEMYENFPLILIESFACGVAVLTTRLGSMAEIVEDDRTGLHFAPGSPHDLAAKVRYAWEHPDIMDRLGAAARRAYELKYTAERNYVELTKIYETARQQAAQAATSRS
jgi:glycosyltransferase involved in cell wall biosynthesis